VDREYGENAARDAQEDAQGAAINLVPNGGIDIGDTQPILLKIYAYKSHFQPYRSWACILATSLFVIFNGWWAFAGGFQADIFFSCYISVSPVLVLGPMLY
jgi:hypothetical protein